MITSPAEAIRFAITSGAYTGWTGLPDNDGRDYFMCLALFKLRELGYVSLDAYTEAREATYQRLGPKAVTINNMFVDQGLGFPHPTDEWPEARAMALKWFNDLADELDNSTAGVDASATNEEA